MLFRKNKKRKHTCCLCGMDLLNEYYGIKSYDDIPFYDFNFYELHKQKCASCGLDFYYLIDLEKLLEETEDENNNTFTMQKQEEQSTDFN